MKERRENLPERPRMFVRAGVHESHQSSAVTAEPNLVVSVVDRPSGL
jgi:hypothetical protein